MIKYHHWTKNVLKSLFAFQLYRYLGSIRPKKNRKGTSSDEAQDTREPCDKKAVVEEQISKQGLIQGGSVIRAKKVYRRVDFMFGSF